MYRIVFFTANMRETIDDDSTFSQKVEYNREVCTNCYRRLYFEYEPHHSHPDSVSDIREYDENVGFDYFSDRGKTGHPSVPRSHCKCGSVDGSKIRPFDKEDTVNAAIRIKNRLEEQDVDIDVETYFDVVKRKKSDPEKQFNEEVIFEEAVEKSLITKNE